MKTIRSYKRGKKNPRESNKKYLGGKIIFLLILMLVVLVGAIVYLQFRNSSAKKIEKQLENILNSAESTENTNSQGFLIAERIYQDMSYEVIEVEDSFCTISVTAPNIYALCFSIFDSSTYETPTNMDDYENAVNFLLEQIDAKLSAGDYDYITNIVDVPLNDNGDIEVTYELTDALYGGLLTLQRELLNNYMRIGRDE